MNEWINVWYEWNAMNEWMTCTNEQTDKRTNGWLNEWMNERTNEWMTVWIYRGMNIWTGDLISEGNWYMCPPFFSDICLLMSSLLPRSSQQNKFTWKQTPSQFLSDHFQRKCYVKRTSKVTSQFRTFDIIGFRPFENVTSLFTGVLVYHFFYERDKSGADPWFNEGRFRKTFAYIISVSERTAK